MFHVKTMQISFLIWSCRAFLLLICTWIHFVCNLLYGNLCCKCRTLFDFFKFPNKLICLNLFTHKIDDIAITSHSCPPSFLRRILGENSISVSQTITVHEVTQSKNNTFSQTDKIQAHSPAKFVCYFSKVEKNKSKR